MPPCAPPKPWDKAKGALHSALATTSMMASKLACVSKKRMQISFARLRRAAKGVFRYIKLGKLIWMDDWSVDLQTEVQSNIIAGF